MTDWIKCEDRLPDDEVHVLVYLGNGIHITSWDNDKHHWYMSGGVTHWMELPDVPRETIEKSEDGVCRCVVTFSGISALKIRCAKHGGPL